MLGAETDLGAMYRQLEQCETDVLSALRKDNEIRVIAEHKRKSPSRGPIRPDSDAAEIARAYEANGAAAISVLTDETFFDGSADDLIAVKKAVQIPVLCKDFILSPIQVMLARIWGADILLLIVAALSKGELAELFRIATQLGMTPLVEVHDEHEVKVATDLGAELLGVNNRNLHTFTVDLETSEWLAEKIPAEIVRVSESGIHDGRDIQRLRKAGYDAVLVGERLMRAKDPGLALRELLA
jgi:indole-3-glycerol phosphate synthase